VLIETTTGREITRGNARVWSCTDDGRYIMGESPDRVYKLWDVPARRSLRVVVLAALGWSLIVGALAYRLIRRRRARVSRGDAEGAERSSSASPRLRVNYPML